jgi:hypothetical protein
VKRSPMPQRRAGLARGKRLKSRNRADAARDQDFGEEAATIRKLPCTVPGCSGYPSQPAHVVSRGAGGGRFDQAPLCHGHHREQHQIGIKSFAKKYGLDLRAEADAIALAHSEPLGIRGLADRWIVRCACGHEWAARPDGCDCIAPKTAALDDCERAALLGWVRRRLAWSPAGRAAATLYTEPHLVRGAMLLDLCVLPISINDLGALAEAAGWPS